MKSYKSLSDFIEFHSLDTDSVGNCVFFGVIHYNSPKKSIEVISEVKFIRNGYEDGKIRIAEANDFEIADYHLDFTPPWQEYEFSPHNGVLTISGNSPKMGGKYNIKVSPA